MSKIQTATIAVADSRFPSESDLIEYLAEKAGVTAFDNLQSDEKKFTFRDGETTYAVSLMDGPISWSNLQTPCALAWHWPEAALEFQSHTNHIIVGVLDDQSDTIDRCLALTRLAAAVCANPGIAPIGVLWNAGLPDNKGAAGCVHRPEDFIAHSEEISRSALPLELWISFLPAGSSETSFVMTTRGLDAFGLKELEAVGKGREPEWVYHRLYNFAHFCLTHPEEVKPGETIGMADDEKIDILAASSRFDPNKDVLLLNFDTIETNKKLEEERNKYDGKDYKL